MFIWAGIAIALGVFNLVASIYYPADSVFLRVNGYIFVLMGGALLFRMRMKKVEGRIEQLEERLSTLEAGRPQSQ